MSFTTPKPIEKAYLGKHALDLVRVSSDQVLDLYMARGITIPVELSSTLHALSDWALSDRDLSDRAPSDRDGVTLTMLAASLRLPHQLVAQRVRKLIASGLITRTADRQDKRRFLLALTDEGHDQARKLRACMADMSDVYHALYEEIDCDLPAKLQAAIQRLQARTLTERFAEIGLLPDRAKSELS